jgi:hypothetical protein
MKIMQCYEIKRWTSQGWRGMKLAFDSNLTNLGKLKFSWSSKNLEYHEAYKVDYKVHSWRELGGHLGVERNWKTNFFA